VFNKDISFTHNCVSFFYFKQTFKNCLLAIVVFYPKGDDMA